MEQPEPNVAAQTEAAAQTEVTEPKVAAKTELPKPAALQETGRQDYASATGERIFDVSNVSIFYGTFKAVTEVTMPIYENEITAFIGSSGSGKTTVLRAFNRMNDLVPGANVA